MKKLILLAILFSAFSFSTQAQTEKKNIFKVNFLSPIVSTGSIFYERVITESASLQLGFFYTGASIGSGDSKTSIRGIGITPEFRYYLSDKGAPQGFFVAPYLRYQSFNLTAKDESTNLDEKAKFTGFGGGLLVGGQWLFKDKISLDVWGGPGLTSRKFEYEGTASEDDFELGALGGFTFRFGATLGFAF
jgi:outer membrane autotransporter protein